jgi:dihydropyrimidinase
MMAEGFDLLIKGGTLVTGRGFFARDVGVRGETIAAVEPRISPAGAERVVEAQGMYLLPGVVDVHTHPLYEDDFASTAVAAAWGGTTTLIHYAYAFPGKKVKETIAEAVETGVRDSCLDFALHVGLFQAENQYPQIADAFELGVRTFKMFMTYQKLGRMTSDYHLTAAFERIGRLGGMAMVHAENGLATDFLEDKFNREGVPAIEAFTRMRPAALEAEAIHRALAIAEVAGCPIYIPHISVARGLEPVAAARKRGQEVYAETCPQYLELTEKDLYRFKALAKIGPPLRTPEDNRALWEGLADGTIDVVASDHAPKAKKAEEDFFQAAYGSPQAETLLTVTYDGGINRNRITLPQMVRVLGENPAKIFGLFPRKGALSPGSDADIVLFDPARKHTLKGESQHTRAGYTLFEGRECLGKPVLTWQRGRLVLDRDKLAVGAGDGKYIPLGRPKA